MKNFQRKFRYIWSIICPKCDIEMDRLECEEKDRIMFQCNFCKSSIYLMNRNKDRQANEGFKA